MNLKKLTEINEEAIQAVRGIRILESLSWPVNSESEFIEAWSQGKVSLPKIEYPKVSYQNEREKLSQLLSSFTPDHPLEVFTAKTIESFIRVARLVESAGTSAVGELSLQIYGKPGDKMPGSSITNVEAAQKLVDIAKSFDHPYIKEPEVCITAEAVKEYLDRKIKTSFGGLGPSVEIYDKMSAKASATATLIKLRPGTCYNQYDSQQLFFHEVLTHSLTGLNGLMQPYLKLLSRGAARTTSTQEGLATFSEIITGSIDLKRMTRLALRILAIDMALNGAEFVDIFKFFVKQGQSLKESYWSTSRIFRGGYPDKSIIFTKDTVYLDGLFKIHTFFRWALLNQRLELTHLLFCGKFSIEDLFLLEQSYKDGLIAKPKFLPPWYRRIEGLAGNLSFSLVANIVHEEEFENYFRQLEPNCQK